MTGPPEELQTPRAEEETTETKPVEAAESPAEELARQEEVRPTASTPSDPPANLAPATTDRLETTTEPALARTRVDPAPTLPNPAAPAPAPAPPPPAAPVAPPVAAPTQEAPAVPPASVAEAPAAPASAGAPELPVEGGFVPGLPDEAAVEGDEEDLDPAEQAALEAFEGGATIAVPTLNEGDRHLGTVVSLSADGAVVDVGGKVEGLLSSRANPADAVAALQQGQEVEVIIARLGEPGEFAQLVFAKEENSEAWDALEEAFRARAVLTGKVNERVKGGLTVDVGVSAFLPGSQVALRADHNLDEWIGKEIEVRVVKLSRRRGNVVVSRRELLEEQLKAAREETLAKIEVGGVVQGVVKNVTSYGAFVDLGGVDGLIHVTDISYGRIKDPTEALAPGQEIEAKVIKLDRERSRVSLSLKDMQPDPWETVEERYAQGARIGGKVASITDYGVFVEIEEGVEGLVHITELTWSKRLKHPNKLVKVGQDIEAVVLKVQPGQRRISLSLRQTTPDPWDGIEARFQTGSIVDGRVRNVTTYGAFIEVEEGVDGLVHVSDMSWDTQPRNPKELVKKGQTIKAVVLNIDPSERRLSLGIKQLEPDVWEKFVALHGVGEVLVGKVSRMAKFGAFVELAPGVEGLCHRSEMPPKEAGKKQSVRTGQSYYFEIIKIDELDRRVGLRCSSYEPVVEEAVAPQAAAAPPPEMPVQEAAEAAVEPVADPTTEAVAEEAAPTEAVADEPVAQEPVAEQPAVEETVETAPVETPAASLEAESTGAEEPAPAADSDAKAASEGRE